MRWARAESRPERAPPDVFHCDVREAWLAAVPDLCNSGCNSDASRATGQGGFAQWLERAGTVRTQRVARGWLVAAAVDITAAAASDVVAILLVVLSSLLKVI